MISRAPKIRISKRAPKSARVSEILQNFARVCKIPRDSARFCEIQQDLEILQMRLFYLFLQDTTWILHCEISVTLKKFTRIYLANFGTDLGRLCEMVQYHMFE